MINEMQDSGATIMMGHKKLDSRHANERTLYVSVFADLGKSQLSIGANLVKNGRI